jgi:hypothetical protein
MDRGDAEFAERADDVGVGTLDIPYDSWLHGDIMQVEEVEKWKKWKK